MWPATSISRNCMIALDTFARAIGHLQWSINKMVCKLIVPFILTEGYFQ
jgi:hypothetical protein